MRPTFLEIEAYARVVGVRIRGWEAYAIREMAYTFMIWNDERRKKDEANKGLKNSVGMDDAKGLKALFAKQGTKSPSRSAKPKK